MNRLLQAAVTLLVLSQVGAAQSSLPARIVGSAPTGLALEVRFSKTVPPAFSSVVGPDCKPGGAWYALFDRIKAGATRHPSAPVTAVDVRSRLEGESVRVNVAVFRGRLLEEKELVASYELRENESVTTDALTELGVKPFVIKVIRVNPSFAYTPAVSINTPSIAVVGVELRNTTLPSYKLTFHNSSHKNVVAMGINVLADNRVRGTSMPQGRDGRHLIKAGTTGEIIVGAAYNAQTTPHGFRPEPPTDQEVVVSSIVFDDGSYEGDVRMAAIFTAFVTGRKIQIAKLIELIDKNANAPFVNVSSALEPLKAEAALLSSDVAPAEIADLPKSFPQLPAKERDGLKVSVDVALAAVKSDFLLCIQEFEKRNAQLGERQYRAWLSGVRHRYQHWLARLGNETKGL